MENRAREKFLVIKLGSIGDIIHAMPAVAFLRRFFPEAQLDWLVETRSKEILAGAKNVDEVVIVDEPRWRSQLWRPSVWAQILERRKALAARRYDTIFDFQGLLKSAVTAAWVGAREIWGGARGSIREPLASIFYTHLVELPPLTAHVIRHHLALVQAFLRAKTGGEAANVSLEDCEFDLNPPRAAVEFAKRNLAAYGLFNFFLVHPGAGWASKRWSPRHYAQLMDALAKKFGAPIVLSYGPHEESLVSEILQATSAKNSVVALAMTLMEYAALVRQARCFIGPDTGPLHIAAALGVPIVGLYAPSDPARNGPFRSGDVVIAKNRGCGFCYRRSCGAHQCIDEIAVEEVVEGVERRLANEKKPQRVEATAHL